MWILVFSKQEVLLYDQISALELRTNVLAAYVSGGRAHEVPAVMDAMKISSKDSFEIAFNYACSMVAVNDLEQAYKALEHAQRLGKRSVASECVYSGFIAHDALKACCCPLPRSIVKYVLIASDSSHAYCRKGNVVG